MADVPRRLQQSGADKMGIVADRVAPGSHRGVTQWSKPPTAKTPTPQSQSSGTTLGFASATYRDPSATVPLGAIGNPSGLIASAGSADTYFEYNGSDGIILLRAGWYQVASTAVVTGATPGDALRAFCFFTTPQTVEGSDIAGLGGTANPVAMSLPFYDDGSGTVVQVAVENHTSANGQVGNPEIHLVAFG